MVQAVSSPGYLFSSWQWAAKPFPPVFSLFSPSKSEVLEKNRASLGDRSDPTVQKVAAFVKPDVTPYRLFSNAGVAGIGVIGDVSTIVRSIVAFFPKYADSVVLPTMGVTTGLATLTGSISAHCAQHRLQIAQELGDRVGCLEAEVDRAGSVTQVAGGVALIAHRVFSTVSLVRGAQVGMQAKTLFGRVGYWVSMAGNLLFSLFFGLSTLWGGIRLHEAYAFRSQMKEAGSSPEKIVAFLEKRLHVTEETVRKRVTDEKLYNEAMETSKKFVTILLDDLRKGGLALPKLSEPELEKVVFSLFSDGKSKGADFEKVAKEKLILSGLQMRIDRQQLKSQNILLRVLGKESLEMVVASLQAKEPLSARMISPNPEIRNTALAEGRILARLAQKQLSTNMLISSAVIGLSVLGLVSTVASLLFLSGPGAVAGLALFGICALGMLILDAYYLLQGLAAGEKGKYEEALIWASNFVLLIAFTTAMFLSSGGVPVIIALAIGIPWLAINTSLLVKLKVDESQGDEIKKREKEKLREELLERIHPLLDKYVIKI